MARGDKLIHHIKNICIPNLKDSRISHCADCPFEDLIVGKEGWLRSLFNHKRSFVEKLNHGQQKIKFN